MMINTTSFADQLQAARDNAAAGQFDDAFLSLQRALDCSDRTEDELFQLDQVYVEVKEKQGRHFSGATITSLFRQLRIAGVTHLKGLSRTNGRWEAWA
jgi:hypothetical protein